MIRTNLLKPLIELLLATAASTAMLLGAAGPCRASVSDASTPPAASPRPTGVAAPAASSRSAKARSTCSPPPTSSATTRRRRRNANSGGGHQSAPLAGRVIGRSEEADAAVVAVPQSALGGLLPGVVPLAPRDNVIRPGDAIISVGCASGAWATAWKGHALGTEGGDLRLRARAGQRTKRIGRLRRRGPTHRRHRPCPGRRRVGGRRHVGPGRLSRL